MMKIREHDGAFAVAEVLGLDPAGGDEYAADVQAALATQGVVCLRMDQPLTD